MEAEIVKSVPTKVAVNSGMADPLPSEQEQPKEFRRDDAAAPLKVRLGGVMSQKRIRAAGNGVFATDDPTPKKRRILIGIDDDDDDGGSEAGTNNRNKSKEVLSAGEIVTVPDTNEGILSFNLNWDAVTSAFLANEMRTWVDEQIAEYLGEAEESMVGFVMDEIEKRSTPKSIIEELEAVLDTDAETLVVGVWRMLIEAQL